MSYWKNMTNSVSSLVGNATGNAEVQAEMKKKDKLIKDLQAEVDKLK